MDFMDISKKRITVRQFPRTPVEEEKIQKILEAASIDLGTVWISYFDKVKARELLRLPETWEPVCMLYIGYPAEDFKPNPRLSGHRKSLSETCFYNIIPSMEE